MYNKNFMSTFDIIITVMEVYMSNKSCVHRKWQEVTNTNSTLEVTSLKAHGQTSF